LRSYQQALYRSREIGKRARRRLRGSVSSPLLNALGITGIIYHQSYSQEGKVLNNLGLAYSALGKHNTAIDFYQQALVIYRKAGDRNGEGTVLWNIGELYFKQKHYDAALAALFLARGIFENILNPDYNMVQEKIDLLCKEVGEKRFAELRTQIELQAPQI